MPAVPRLGIAVLAGFVATFIATRWGYISDIQLGLPRFDFSSAIGAQISPKDASPAFLYTWGAVTHYMDGVIFAILYAWFVSDRLPGPSILRGVLYGLLVWIGFGIIYGPLSGWGLFGVAFGGLFALTVLIWHIVWGIALGVLYHAAPIEARA